ncbi:efflux RND transporter periplasmic adaptor subunit [Nitrosovibrio tenuis]|uniref:RND family efflux transporter, MFP subunit n=1 Tax=Nitrosovibrio tenuis TaxID=1233 RepID=A0A1H7G3B2_9PROT|nr:efflux RND transporter periplasmic adaptor subunit [Nitrosovibrio tenuis]SEK32823.1 RND family efflux transporter, MFP subunit [Nitrosovibrio tenuis]
MENLRKKNTVIIAIVLLGFLIYLGYRVVESRKDTASLTKQAMENDVPTVAIVHAEPLPAQETIQLPGTIEAWFQAPIYAQVSGYVKMWHKDWGARVQRGDVLAEINAPALDAQYRQAKADLASEVALYDLAELTADRYIALRKNQAVSEQAISVKVAEAKAQEAKVNAAMQNVRNFEALIGFKTIIAPYDGVVINRAINVGDFINKEGTISTPQGEVRNLYTVADISRLRLFVSVPERFGALMHDGLKAHLTVPQFPNRQFTAEFLTTARGFDVSTRTVVTQFVIENEEKDLWPGSYASVNLSVDVENKHLSIPSSSLVFDEMGTRVAVVDDNNIVHFKPIKISRILDATVELTEGVSTEDRIINNPSAAILEGDKVVIVEPAPGYDLINKPKEQVSGASKPASHAETQDPKLKQQALKASHAP